MFASALLRSSQPRLIVRAGRASAGTKFALRGYATFPGGKPNQARMGQGGGTTAKNDSSEKSFFSWLNNINPFALVGAATILISGYTLIIKPYFEWRTDLKKRADDRVKEEESGKVGYSDEEIAQFPFDTKNVVFVLGGPGSGKGTNSAKLVEDFGFVHLSAGDLLRAEQQREVSQYGELIGHYIREGLIVPHEITIGLLRNAMMDHPASNRFLIDGFPRNLVQAKAFEDTVCKAKKVLYFECPEATMLERLLDRGKTSGRTDDNIGSIKKRFRTYINDSKPVIDEYAKEGKVMTVSCEASVEDVYKHTHDQIEALLRTLKKQAAEEKQSAKEKQAAKENSDKK
ncbi:bifunctional uridylate/adenylate kinase [Coemansia sp. RSA 2167]|nr:bifunctional uridylate/adenylate kinase [Coemansia sp. RSA 1591]KAJ1793647.1 bifunctional uridylate/adenylate kinase [Coemansia sp. RSA 2167]KAJ2154761.1 bifunctional uridylate/adenylate kinase [Coemansia sp. RSA 637]KAJ2166271.1 bifunctional uridylate/adenylate kinase [Coemansia sp. RSA 562]KAJ2191215.1 bifunctional uridylate/adenylate kinase [Coemansia sp. RSA 532]KAJ2207360.1 bifunctional uridylate/adenylate kinase [Coemansia sp. RSA 521]KAJ2226608.1 bifunctional uridylate/adenylate kin